MKKTLLTSALLCLLAACARRIPPIARQQRLPATAELNIFNWSDYVDPETVAAFARAEKNQSALRLLRQ